MTLTINTALAAGNVAVQMQQTQHSIDLINAAIANQNLLCGLSICDPDGGNVRQVISFRLDPASSLTGLNSALSLCNNILAALTSQLGAF